GALYARSGESTYVPEGGPLSKGRGSQAGQTAPTPGSQLAATTSAVPAPGAPASAGDGSRCASPCARGGRAATGRSPASRAGSGAATRTGRPGSRCPAAGASPNPHRNPPPAATPRPSPPGWSW